MDYQLYVGGLDATRKGFCWSKERLDPLSLDPSCLGETFGFVVCVTQCLKSV